MGIVAEVASALAFPSTEQSSHTSGALIIIDGASECV